MGRSSSESGVPPNPRPEELENVTVGYRSGQRYVSCFCGQEVSRSIVPHLKCDHPRVWDDWVQQFVSLRASGSPLKKVMRQFRAGNGPLLFSWTVIDRAIKSAVESGKIKYTPTLNKPVKYWEPQVFQESTGTVWDFPQRGDWAVHSSDYRGNWPPQLVRNLILKFTEPGDQILDAFVGGGTTLVEAWLLGRKSAGIDLSKLALQTTHAKLSDMARLAEGDSRINLLNEFRPVVIGGDALRLETLASKRGIAPETVKLICAHPPYLDSLQFTDNNRNDLSRIRDPEIFYRRIGAFARHASKMLAADGVCALLIGDVRKKGRLIPLGFDSVARFQRHGLRLESIVIKTQNHDRTTEFYRESGGDRLLLTHEYLFILRK